MDTAALLTITRPIVDGRGRGLSGAERDDLVQAVLERYLRRFGDDEGPSDVTAWVEVTTRRALTDHHREAGRGRAVPSSEAADGADDTLAPVVRSLFSLALDPAAAGPVEQVLDRFLALLEDPVTEQVVRRTWLSQDTPATIAADLGLGVDAVDRRVSRARVRLLLLLSRRPDLLGEVQRRLPEAC